MDIQLLICDCDGVLVDSEIIVERERQRLLAEHFPEEVAEVERLLAGTFGLKTRDILARIEAHFGSALPAGFCEHLLAHIRAATRDQAEPITGVRDALLALELPLAVASNSQRDGVEHALRRAGLVERVNAGVFSADDVERPKPAPDIYLLAAERNGVAPSRCLVVEDSATGATAALRAGMRVIGFLGASHIPPEHAEVLQELGVHALMGQMHELPGLVRQFGGA